MKVGDLVSVAKEAEMLDWIKSILTTRDKASLLYGVIVEERPLNDGCCYTIHWFYNDGSDYCSKLMGFEKRHLKRMK